MLSRPCGRVPRRRGEQGHLPNHGAITNDRQQGLALIGGLDDLQLAGRDDVRVVALVALLEQRLAR